MEPQRNTNATLVDLLDRLLDKGLVIHADLIVSVAGIPLIGVSLRAALAGMETMLKYGVMQAWDERTRAWETEHRRKKEMSRTQGEEIILKILGAYYSDEGIITAWRYGYIYLTSTTLALYHSDFCEVLFETPLEKIKGLIVRVEKDFKTREREELCLLLDGEKVSRLRALNVRHLKETIEKRMNDMGIPLQKEIPFLHFEERTASHVDEGEQVLIRSKLWYLTESESIASNTWKPGFLHLTNKRLFWLYDFKREVLLEIPTDKLISSRIGIRDPGGFLNRKKVLDVLHDVNGAERVATFSGDTLEEWDKVLKEIINKDKTNQYGDETETCPQCGRTAFIKQLLYEGCSRCSWKSARTHNVLSIIK
ncbi:MAG: gas vesicle protein [Thermodesulfobacteriota bacterium]|nr:gas vesicle protein [Thermodesulfobacteriota bacterium]